jgi:succinyl-diaminopimelate desuccinylase
MYRKEIEEYFDKHSEELIRDIGTLVAIPSTGIGKILDGPEPFGHNCALALKAGTEIMEKLGFKVTNLDNYVIYADLNDKEDTLGIFAHLDVVPEGEGWTSDPYKMDIRDNVLYGRGVSDDKGPAMAALYALAAAREINPNMSKNCRIILGANEEQGSADIRHYKEHCPVPPSVFSPDSSFPVINIEKGGLSPRFGAQWEESKALPRLRSLTGEKTGNIIPKYSVAVLEGIDLKDLDKAIAETEASTGVKFTYVEENGLITVTAEGHGAHASLPDQGNNALTANVQMLASLPLAPSPCRDAIKGLSRILPHNDYHGHFLGIDVEDEISGPMTCTFSICNLNDTGFHASCDCRAPVCASKENVLDPLHEKVLGAGFTFDSEPVIRQPHHTPADSDIVVNALAAYEEFTGNKGYCFAVGGGTYIHGMHNGIAFGTCMPGEDTRIHGADEFMTIENLIKSAKIYTRLILEMCK